MKNLKKLFILLVLFIPTIAFADMGAPQARPYEMVVVNVDGIDYYNYSGEKAGHLNKDETVTISYEYDGTYYLSKKDGDNYTSLGSIKSTEGLVLVQDIVDPTKITDDSSITKYSSKKSAIVYNKSGVDIYQGPAPVYKKIGSIKEGTKLSYEYAVDGGGGETYIYVTNNGKTGWVNILEKNVLIENSTQYIFKNDVKTSCGTIPKNTISTPKYKTDMWSRSTQFEYNGCKALIETLKSNEVLNFSYVSSDWSNSYKAKKEITLYETADTSSKVIATIPADTEITILAMEEQYGEPTSAQYIDYDGKRGWAIEDIQNYEHLNNSSKDVKVADTINTTKKEAKEVKKETKEKEDSNKLSPKELVIICVSFAVLLSVTAVVIIVLINKKRKKNKIDKNNMKEE